MTLEVDRVRRSFPILSRRIAGNPLVYLDSAASSLTPEEVLDAEASFYRHFRANVHRGRHALSEEASDAFERARTEIGAFVGAAPEEIVFTAGTTAALNLVADGLELPEDAEVLTSPGDHHSTLLPWRRRWAVRPIEGSPLRPMDPDALRASIGKRSRVLVLSHASNVTGLIQPVRELCRIAREHDLVTVIDAAQSAPHLRLRVTEVGCDFLAFSGHKMLGPTGVGVLYGRRDALDGLKPRDLGGGVVTHVSRWDLALRPPPARFEAGTPNVAGVLGLAAAVRFITSLGWEDVASHAEGLARALEEGLSAIRGVRILAAEGAALPIVSWTAPSCAVDLEDLSVALSDRYGVMTRAGRQCAHPLFEALRCPGGALRMSAYLYNTRDEIRHACDSVARILSILS